MTHKLGENIPMDDKSNLGALFLNDKRGNDKAPDYRGELTTGTTKLSISAWRNYNGRSYSEAGRGILFANPNKKTDKHPDMVGCVTSPQGRRVFLSAWDRVSEKGNNYLRLALKDWENQFTEVGEDVLSIACQDWKEK